MLFNSRWTPTTHSFSSPSSGSLAKDASIFGLRSSPTVTSGAPLKVLVLLHGYPQNHTLWHLVVEELEARGVLDEWEVVIPDLPGYGKSIKQPSPDGSHAAHSKRATAQDIITYVDTIFPDLNVKFVVAGHDRGARVAYRMAKDHRDRVAGICVMDIVPTQQVFDRMTDIHEELFKMYHWVFLALPPPLPETLIAASYKFYYQHTIESWTGSRYKGKMNAEATSHWIEQYQDPKVIEGSCEDYRAGATIDLLHDAEDVKEGADKVDAPLLSLYSWWLGSRFDVNKSWTALAKGEVVCSQVGGEETGHFLPGEAGEETGRRLAEWLQTF